MTPAVPSPGPPQTERIRKVWEAQRTALATAFPASGGTVLHLPKGLSRRNPGGDHTCTTFRDPTVR